MANQTKRTAAASILALAAFFVLIAGAGCKSSPKDSAPPQEKTAGAQPQAPRDGGTPVSPLPQAAGPRPKIEADRTMIDLGTMWKKKAVLTESFTLRNAGDAVLEIKGVGCSWECTSSGPKDITLNPGESWELPVELNLEEQTGLKLNRVVVLSNDPEHPELELKIFGSVQEPIAVDPANGYYFGNIGPKETRQKTLVVKNNSPDPMDLKLVRSEGRNFSAKVETVTPGKEYRLIVTASPPYQPSANRGKLVFATGLAVQPELVLLPQATLPPRLAYPQALSVPQPLTPGTSLIWSIRNNGDKPMKVVGATTVLEGVATEITSAHDGQVHNVTLRFSKPITLPPEGSELAIRTDDSEFATIRVRLVPEELPVDPESPGPPHGLPDNN